MGVPFHDERDFEFALKHNIQITQVVDGNEGDDLKDYVLCNSAEYTGLKVPDAVDKILARLEKLGVGKQTTEYRLRDWLVSR